MVKRIAAAFGHASSWTALTPSLIPRTWWMTAINVAVNAYAGQKAGELAHALLNRNRQNTPAAPSRSQRPSQHYAQHPKHPSNSTSPTPTGFRIARPATQSVSRNVALLSLAGAGSAFAISRSIREQEDIAQRTNDHTVSVREHVFGYIVGELGWLSLDLASLGMNRLRQRLERRLHTRLPFMPELVITALSMGAIAYSSRKLISTILFRLAEQAVRSDFARPSLTRRPSEPQRSGSRYSQEPFSTLGYHGRDFVTSGPRKDRIQATLKRTSGKSHTPTDTAHEPIRIFIGRLSHPDLSDAADAAVRELDRTGAFDREALLLVTNTGSGWTPQWSVEAFEYLMGGNCASVAIQYSFAGSWLAFLIHRDQAIYASRALLEAVERHLSTLDEHSRPRIYVTGESLGALGGHGAFTTLTDMRQRVDGALWTGTPRTTPIFKNLIASRHVLSPEIQPVIGRGGRVRFVQKPKQLKESPLGPYQPWTGARIVYAQHPSDPVVWWSPSMVIRKPDWLREPRGKDVSPYVVWFPWLTFWQLLADMPRSVQLSGGRGHSYHREVVHYWNEILDTGFTKKDCTKIGDAIADDIARKSTGQAWRHPEQNTAHQSLFDKLLWAILQRRKES